MGKKLNLNNRQRSIDAARALWLLAVEKNDANGMNCVCSFVPPAAKAAWLLRHKCGDPMAQAEAVTVLAMAIERAADARDSIAIGRSPQEFVRLARPS